MSGLQKKSIGHESGFQQKDIESKKPVHFSKKKNEIFSEHETSGRSCSLSLSEGHSDATFVSFGYSPHESTSNHSRIMAKDFKSIQHSQYWPGLQSECRNGWQRSPPGKRKTTMKKLKCLPREIYPTRLLNFQKNLISNFIGPKPATLVPK